MMMTREGLLTPVRLYKQYVLVFLGVLLLDIDIPKVFLVSLAILLSLLMLGMGATVTIDTVKSVIKNPKAFFIGFASQYGWMPLIAFALAFIFDLSNLEAIGLIIVGCAPGGTTSQLFTYFAKGDVTLSIAMTFASTLVAFGMLPLLTYLYTIPFRDESVQIPFFQIFLALLLVVVPVGIGMGIKYKSDRAAKICEKAGSIGGSIAVVIALVLGSIINAEVWQSSYKIWFSSMLLPLVGCFLGYLAAYFLGATPAQQRTISLETGIQNSSLTITIVAFSFEGAKRDEVLLVPLLYSLWLFIDAILIVLFFRFVLIPYWSKDGASAQLKDETQTVDLPTIDTPKAEEADHEEIKLDDEPENKTEDKRHSKAESESDSDSDTN